MNLEYNERGRKVYEHPPTSHQAPTAGGSQVMAEYQFITLPETFDAQSFWTHVDRSSSGGCWLWRGPIDKNCGYGCLTVPNRGGTGAHRVSWMLNIGPIVAGLCVMHLCDVPSCVNPSHLVLGTKAANNADKILKGRDWCFNREKTRCHKGHEYSYVDGRGRRVCRACRNEQKSKWSYAQRAKGRRRIRNHWTPRIDAALSSATREGA